MVSGKAGTLHRKQSHDQVKLVVRGDGEKLFDDVVTHVLCRVEDPPAQMGSIVPTEGKCVEAAGAEQARNLSHCIGDGSADVRIERRIPQLMRARRVAPRGHSGGARLVAALPGTNRGVASPRTATVFRSIEVGVELFFVVVEDEEGLLILGLKDHPREVAFSARALETAFQHRDHTNPFELVLQNLTDSDADLPGHGAGLPEE